MRIGFIGLGNMGGPMAKHILDAGHALTVYDVRKDAASTHLQGGARWAESPMAVAAASEIVFTSLPGPKEVEAVALGEGGVLQGAAPGTVYIEITILRQSRRSWGREPLKAVVVILSGATPGGEQGPTGSPPRGHLFLLLEQLELL